MMIGCVLDVCVPLFVLLVAVPPAGSFLQQPSCAADFVATVVRSTVRNILSLVYLLVPVYILGESQPAL